MSDNINIRKYLKIAEQIKENIINGNYSVGENLPTVKKLSEMFDVNPQTICKATAYLSSLGYLNPIQGSGLKVCLPEKISKTNTIAMLIDRSRSLLLDLDKLDNYHSKDIYLAYLMLNQKKNINSQFIIFDSNDKTVNNDFLNSIENVNGLIVQETLPDCYFTAIEEKNIPVVLINRQIPENYKKRIGSVLISEKNIGVLINYLITLGHKKILFALSNEFEKNTVTEQRHKVMLEEICSSWKGEFDIEIEVFEYKSNDFDSAEKLKLLIEKGYTAAWAYNDISALGLYSLIRMCEKKIPYDFSIAGFDDISAAQMSDPPLTTIKVNRFQLAEDSLKILDKLIKNPANRQIIETLETELIIRRSTFRKNN